MNQNPSESQTVESQSSTTSLTVSGLNMSIDSQVQKWPLYPDHTSSYAPQSLDSVNELTEVVYHEIP